MKKMILFSLVFSHSTFAFSADSFETCSAKDLVQIQEEIKEQAEHGNTNISYIKNRDQQIVGFFAADNDRGAYAELCEYFFPDEMTVSNRWYYWESEASSNVSTWKKNETMEMHQDEGIAHFKVTKVTNAGVEGLFEVIGWGEGDQEVVASDVVVFTPAN